MPNFFQRLILLSLLTCSLIDCQQLDCNFDNKTLCNWSNGINGVEDDFDWLIDNTVAIDGFHSIPRTIAGSGYFAFAQGRFRPIENDAAKTWLRSPTIDGISRPATLTFVVWKTAIPPVLQVCVRDAGDTSLRCLDTISGLGEQTWVQRIVTIPPNASPFQIVFVATGFRTALDLVGIDDLTFRYVGARSASVFRTRKPLLQDAGEEFENGFAAVEQVNIDDSFYEKTSPVNKVPESRQKNADNEFVAPVWNVAGTNNQRQTPPEYKAKTIHHNGQKIEQSGGKNDEDNTNTYFIGTGRPEVFFVAASHSYQQTDGRKENIYITAPSLYNTPPLYHTNGGGGHLYRTTPDDKAHAYSTTEEQHAYSTTEPSEHRHAYFTTEPKSHLYITSSTSVPHVYPTSAEVHLYETTKKSDGGIGGENGGSCNGIVCYFDDNLCGWYNDLKANFDWKTKSSADARKIMGDSSERDSYVFVSGNNRNRQQRAALRSQPLKVPPDAYFEFLAFVSDSTAGHLAIRSSDVSGEKVLWETFGYKSLGGHGWQRVRIKLPERSGVVLIIEANELSTGMFIGVDDIRLTDTLGKDINCESSSSMMYASTSSMVYESTSSMNYGSTSTTMLYFTEQQTTEAQTSRTDAPPPVYGLDKLAVERKVPDSAEPEFRAPTRSPLSSGRQIHQEVSVDVLGEHGGSLLNPERVEATEAPPPISQFYPKQFYANLQTEFQAPFDHPKAGNLINNDHSRSDGPLRRLVLRSFTPEPYLNDISYKKSTKHEKRASQEPARSSTTATSVQPDPLGVNDFIRRVSNDLTSLLGINRQSYLYGSDVFNAFAKPQESPKYDANYWLRSLFGRKKKRSV